MKLIHTWWSGFWLDILETIIRTTTQKCEAPQKNEAECSSKEDQEPLLRTTSDTREVAGSPQDLHPAVAGVEKDEYSKDLPDEFTNSREDPTNGFDLSASNLVQQIELEKLRLSIVTEENRRELVRLQVEEIKLKTVEEETQLAKARLELRKLEGNTFSGFYIWIFVNIYIGRDQINPGNTMGVDLIPASGFSFFSEIRRTKLTFKLSRENNNVSDLMGCFDTPEH